MAQAQKTLDIKIGGTDPNAPDIIPNDARRSPQPNPPVRPKWDTDPPEVESTGGEKFNISNAPLGG